MLLKALIGLLVCWNGFVQGYLIGVGMGDVTGPASDVNMMGYAMPQQTTGGIHFRNRARAFVIGGDKAAQDAKVKRFAFVSMDTGMGSIAITEEVVKRLHKKYPGVYTKDNLSISGTHTHSAPAGFLQTVLFQVTSLGFVHETFDAFVSGIVMAVSQAHESAKPNRKIRLAKGAMECGYASINRSPTSYLRNPKKERDQYSCNTDLDMTILRFDDTDGSPIGMLNWFAVHGTSMPNTNHLINGDNKGYASQLFEFWVNGPDVETGKSDSKFVAAFASTNLGDVSPNINGTFCTDTKLPCQELHSTCHGANEYCHGRGPSSDPFESAAIIGRRQAEFAKKLFQPITKTPVRRFRLQDQFIDGEFDSSAFEKDVADLRVDVGGDEVDFVHVYRDMSKIKVQLSANETAETCKPAMGYSFAAGTTDGPGMFDFFQGENNTNPFWEIVRDFLEVPSKEIEKCQHPKAVLFATGEMTFPYPWDPSVLPLQIFRIGNQIAILSVPAEFTTMAGRRLRKAVRDVLVEGGLLDKESGQVVIAGLANEYASYCTTYEEYQAQRYEAGSTLYGPHSHRAYVQEFVGLAHDMVAGRAPADPGPNPDNLLDRQISLVPYPLPDGVPRGSSFGQVEEDVEAEYDLSKNKDVVIYATFRSANPRNNMRPEGTFLHIQQLQPDQTWKNIASDSDFETRFIWERESLFQSRARIEWRPFDSQVRRSSGQYRIVHYGDRKHITGSIESFTGRSSTFKLVMPETYIDKEMQIAENSNFVKFFLDL